MLTSANQATTKYHQILANSDPNFQNNDAGLSEDTLAIDQVFKDSLALLDGDDLPENPTIATGS